MNKCWAYSLGDCAGGISKEHYISKNLFPSGRVTISGFDWLKGKEKVLPIQNLVANILCRKHNTALSELDAEVNNFMGILNKIKTQEHFLKSVKVLSVQPDSYLVNGSLLERWLAKCIVGAFCAVAKKEMNVFWQLNGNNSYNPPTEIVRAIYGLDNFPEPMGLYSMRNNIPYNKNSNNTENGVLVEILNSLNNKVKDGILGAIIEINNFPFLIWLSNVSPYDFRFESSSNYFTKSTEIGHRPYKVESIMDNIVTSSIDFSYSPTSNILSTTP